LTKAYNYDIIHKPIKRLYACKSAFMLNTMANMALASTLFLSPASVSVYENAGQAGELVVNTQKTLASEYLDLDYRYPVETTSQGFKSNILTSLYYFSRIEAGDSEKDNPNAENDVPKLFSIKLNPGEVLAFQDNIPEEYTKYTVKTQKSYYRASEGYNLTAGLWGNGVCHLATLMNWVATEAGLQVNAPTRHDFAKIPGTDPKYGTSISTRSPKVQNLYIKNNQGFPVEFKFMILGNMLNLSITASPEYVY